MIYVTFADQKGAMALARDCVENKLAACANLFQPHTSIYRWQGKVETSTEIAVIFKTTRDAAERLRQYIEKHHSYDVPCVVTLDPSAVANPFSEWIQNSVE